MKFLVTFVTGLAVVSTALAATAYVGGADQFRLDHGLACQSCVGVANATSAFVASPALQQHLEASLRQNVCAKLSTNQGRQCEEDVSSLLPALLPVIARLDATTACASANMCGPEAAAVEQFLAMAAEHDAGHASPATANGLPCPMCTFLVTQLLSLLESESTENDIMAEAHSACEKVAAAQRDACNSRVDLYGRLAFLLIRDISPEGVCHLAQSCPPDAQFPGQITLPQPLTASLAALFQPQLIAKSNDGECDTCKEIVVEAARMLANPEIQRQLLGDAKQACEIFKTLKDQCVSYIELYGPLAITVALGYLQPQTLCTQLGYCKPLPPPLSIHAQLHASLA